MGISARWPLGHDMITLPPGTDPAQPLSDEDYAITPETRGLLEGIARRLAFNEAVRSRRQHAPAESPIIRELWAARAAFLADPARVAAAEASFREDMTEWESSPKRQQKRQAEVEANRWLDRLDQWGRLAYASDATLALLAVAMADDKAAGVYSDAHRDALSDADAEATANNPTEPKPQLPFYVLAPGNTTETSLAEHFTEAHSGRYRELNEYGWDERRGRWYVFEDGRWTLGRHILKDVQRIVTLAASGLPPAHQRAALSFTKFKHILELAKPEMTYDDWDRYGNLLCQPNGDIIDLRDAPVSPNVDRLRMTKRAGANV